MPRLVRWIVLGLVPAFLSGGQQPAAAQSRADEAMRRFREGKIDIMEQLLFKQSGKTTRIIYLRELVTPQSLPAYCGEGLFGQMRQRFVIDLPSKKVVVGVSAADWQKLACHEMEGENLIDLR